MDTITAAVVIVALVVFGYIVVNLFELQKKALTIQAQNPGQKKAGISNLADYVGGLEFAHDNAVQIYNAQFDQCMAQKMPKEQAEQILKPMKDKIDQMETVLKIPGPLREIGAKLADVGINKVHKIINEFEV